MNEIRLLSHHGDMDGIRWGTVDFGHAQYRRWHHDLLTDRLTLWRHVIGERYAPEHDTGMLDITRRLVEQHGDGVKTGIRQNCEPIDVLSSEILSDVTTYDQER